jgi:putative membrane protein
VQQSRQLAVVPVVGGVVWLAAAGIAAAHGIGPPGPTLFEVLTTWSLDPLPWIGTVLAGAAYLVAVRRVNGSNPRVPVPAWRIVAWLAGLASILVALTSAIDVYAETFLSVHMVQHLLLAMVAPPLLALGAPITLLLRVSSRGARQGWILPVLHSRLVRVLASPLVAWPLFTVAMFVTHFSPLYDAALEDPTIHIAEHAVFIATGLLFWWPVVAADPLPRRPGYGLRLAYVVLQMPVNAAVGLIIYFSPTVLYAHYATLIRSWGPSAAVDQQIGGAVMWGGGDVLLLTAIPLIVAAWMRADGRNALRSDARRLAAATASMSVAVGDAEGEPRRA